MPRNPRRQMTRRTAPPRPTYPGAVQPGGTAEQPVRRTAASTRAADYVARQTPALRNEVKRVTIVTSICVLLLAVLTVVDRIQ